MSILYFYNALISLAKTMIGLFIPVYLYSLGYNLISVILFSIGLSLMHLILTPTAVKIIKKIGFKYMILLSTPIYITHIFILKYVAQEIIYFHLGWITLGIYAAFFWPAYHSEIASRGSIKHRSSEIGTFQIVATLFATLAPFIGGFILEFYSYEILIIVITTIMILATIPLLFAKDIKLKKYDFNFKDFLRIAKTNHFKKNKKAFASEGIEMFLNITIWPLVLFLFFLNSNYFKLGILFTIVSFIGIAIVYFIKKYLDNHSRKKTLEFVCKGLSLNWFLRSLIFLIGSILLYFVESTFKLLTQVYSLSFMSIFYNNE
jgi:hypothetical protein